MIPGTSFADIFAKLGGAFTLVSLAGNNLASNLEKIPRNNAHTFLGYNGQTEFGICRNFGAERFYTWEDTIIDCRSCPTLLESDALKKIDESIEKSRKFKSFKHFVSEKSGQLLEVGAFHSVLRGTDNMRYNIRRNTKIEDFDIVRIGMKITATDEAAFKAGLENMRIAQSPLHISKPVIKKPVLQASQLAEA